MTHQRASELYQTGDLDGAIAAAEDTVKASPTDTTVRGLLCEFLCFAGEIDRADKHLDLIADQDSTVAAGVALFRQLLRGETWRHEVFAQGRPPELLSDPPAHLQTALKALTVLREGADRQARSLCEQVEAIRPAAAGGTRDDAQFGDLRDLDDITASVLELITSTGEYYWIPWEQVVWLQFAAPRRPRDLIWRKAEVAVRGGPEGVVYIPALYPGSASSGDDAIRLGRATDWPDPGEGPMRGVGQRTLLFDETDIPFLELRDITFDGGEETCP